MAALLSTLATARRPREVADVDRPVARDRATAHGATHFTHRFQPMTGLTPRAMTASSTSTCRWRASCGCWRSSGIPARRASRCSSFLIRRHAVHVRGAWLRRGIPARLDAGRARTGARWRSVGLHQLSRALSRPQDARAALDRRAECQATAFLAARRRRRAVQATLGREQEYLLDRDHFALRPTRRSPTAPAGRGPPRGSSSRITVSGSIPPRVLAFMEELEFVSHGWHPGKTR